MPLSRILVSTLVSAVIGGIRGYLWHRERQKRIKRRLPSPASLAAPLFVGGGVGASSTSGPQWGWAWFHSAASSMRGLAFYYRDSTLGPCMRVVADLRNNPDETTIREAIAASLPTGGHPVSLGPHVLVASDGVDAEESRAARECFESGVAPEAAGGMVLMRVTASERAIFALPERPAFVDSIF